MNHLVRLYDDTKAVRPLAPPQVSPHNRGWRIHVQWWLNHVRRWPRQFHRLRHRRKHINAPSSTTARRWTTRQSPTPTHLHHRHPRYHHPVWLLFLHPSCARMQTLSATWDNDDDNKHIATRLPDFHQQGSFHQPSDHQSDARP